MRCRESKLCPLHISEKTMYKVLFDLMHYINLLQNELNICSALSAIRRTQIRDINSNIAKYRPDVSALQHDFNEWFALNGLRKTGNIYI